MTKGQKTGDKEGEQSKIAFEKGLSPKVRARVATAFGILRRETSPSRDFFRTFDNWMETLDPTDQLCVLETLGYMDTSDAVRILNIVSDPYGRYLENNEDRTMFAVSSGLIKPPTAQDVEKYQETMEAFENDPNGGPDKVLVTYRWLDNLSAGQRNAFRKRITRMETTHAVRALISISRGNDESGMTETAKGLWLIS